MADDGAPTDLERQVAVLKDQLEETRKELAALKEQQAAVAPGVIEALGLDTPTGRRQALKYGGGAATLPALLAYASSQKAEADAVAADVGTQADPWQKGWFHALAAGDGADALGFDSPLAFNHTAISSSTTVTDANVIEYDPSVSGFTITLGSELEERGLPVILQETGGSANSVTVDTQSGNNIDGSSSITLNHANARTELLFEGGEWRTDQFTVTVDARSLVIGGTLYEEDANSPLTASSTSSTTYSVSGSYSDIIIIPEKPHPASFDQLRVNGDSGSNYDFTDNSDTETTGQTEWAINRVQTTAYLQITGSSSTGRIGLFVANALSSTGVTVYGDNTNVSEPITQFTFLDSGGSNRDINARVYGRVMDI